MTRKDLESLGFKKEAYYKYVEQKEGNVDNFDILNVINKNDINTLPDLDYNTVSKFLANQIEKLEDEIQYEKEEREIAISNYNRKIARKMVEVGLLKSKTTTSLTKDLATVMPNQFDSRKIDFITKVLGSNISTDNYDLLNQYFDISREKDSQIYPLVIPKELLSLFRQGEVNVIYFDNIEDIIRFKQDHSSVLSAFKKEALNYFNEYNSFRMKLYQFGNYISISEIEECLKFHQEKVDYKVVNTIQDKIEQIGNIIKSSKLYLSKKKKNEIEEILHEIINPMEIAVRQIKQWYKNHMSNEILGIKIENNFNLEGIIENPENDKYLRDLAEKRLNKIIDFGYDIDVVKRRMELANNKYDQSLNEIVSKIINNNPELDNKNVRTALDLCYKLSYYDTDNDYLISYSTPKRTKFLEKVKTKNKIN